MLQLKKLLVISVVCTSFVNVNGCFSSGTAKKNEKTAQSSEALPLQLNDEPIQTNLLSAEDLNDDEKLKKVRFILLQINFFQAYLDSFGYTDAVSQEPTKHPGTLNEEALKYRLVSGLL